MEPPTLEQRKLFVVSEIDLAQKLGVSRKTMRARRDKVLVFGRDYWKKSDKAPVFLTEAAARLLLGEDVPEEAVTESVEVAKVVPPPQPVVQLAPDEGIVTRANFANPRIIQVTNHDRTKTINVVVSSSVNFVLGMTIKYRMDPGSDVGYLVGRCPRYRGRW